MRGHSVLRGVRAGFNARPVPRPKRKTWLTELIARHTPTREELAGNKWLAPIAHRFLSPELWRMTRRSVPRAVSLGLFCAFIIPIGQILLAAFFALPARANVPLAVLVTFITNPFTVPFWLVAANRVGEVVLKVDAAAGGMANEQVRSGRWAGLLDFVELAGVTAFGFIVLAVVSASLGYVLASWIWRYVIGRRVRRRRARRGRAASRP